MKRFIYWLVTVCSTIILIGGLGCIAIFAITFDSTAASWYGIGWGVAAILAALLLVRTVEKSWSRFFDHILSGITFSF